MIWALRLGYSFGDRTHPRPPVVLAANSRPAKPRYCSAKNAGHGARANPGFRSDREGKATNQSREAADASGSSRRSGSAPQAEIRRARQFRATRAVTRPDAKRRTRITRGSSQRGTSSCRTSRPGRSSRRGARRWRRFCSAAAPTGVVASTGSCSIASTGPSWWMSSDGPPHVVVSAITAHLADKLRRLRESLEGA